MKTIIEEIDQEINEEIAKPYTDDYTKKQKVKQLRVLQHAKRRIIDYNITKPAPGSFCEQLIFNRAIAGDNIKLPKNYYDRLLEDIYESERRVYIGGLVKNRKFWTISQYYRFYVYGYLHRINIFLYRYMHKSNEERIRDIKNWYRISIRFRVRNARWYLLNLFKNNKNG